MKNVDRVISVVFMIISLIFFFETTKLPDDSVMYPRFMIGIMFFFSVLLFIKSFIDKKSGKSWRDLFGKVQWKRFLFVLLASLIYLLLINISGFFAATFIYLLGSMVYLKATKLTMLISIPTFLLLLFLIFRSFLKVPLPTGFLL